MSSINFCDVAEAFSPICQSVTIADCLEPDMPIIYVNKGFEHFSGYTREEIIGRNCRWLQGDTKDQNSIRIMREAISQKSTCIVDVINYKKDGSRIINRLSLLPVFNNNKNLRYYIGLQSNISALKEIERKILGHMSLKFLSAA